MAALLFEQLLSKTFWVQLLHFPCPSTFERELAFPPLELTAGKRDSKALPRTTRHLQSDMEPGHWGIIFFSDHWAHFIHGWQWLWRHLAAQLLWHPLEAVYSSPTQHAHTFVNLVSYCIHQPFRVLQQKLVAVFNKCKGLYCESSAAHSAIWRVILFGITRALTVIYFRLMRYQFSVKRLFKKHS